MQKYGESLDDWNTQKEKTVPISGTADILFLESKRLKKQKRDREALTLINVALENDETNFEYHLQKAKILEAMGRFSESERAYDDAIGLNDSDDIYEGKAVMLYRWANSLNDKKRALELIDEALLIMPESSQDEYLERFLYLKGSILDCLGKPIESRKCYMMAEGMVDEIQKLDEQVSFLKNSTDTLINITGTRFYHGMEPFRKGVIVNLIKEDDNEHDPDAIRVELDGETVGYVANNEYTLVENVSAASEIRNSKSDRAEVMMIYLDEYVIARLV